MDQEQARRHMVTNDLARHGVHDPLVLAAMGKVERERFVPPDLRDMAYWNGPLPIGRGQTISQPYIVALMTEALQLKGGEHVLEVGAGSGYAAAILAEIAGTVLTIERVAELADRARSVLDGLNIRNVTVIHGDGTRGHNASAPYDAIVVTAGGPHVPRPLMDQLKIGGRLVIPIGSEESFQTLVRVTRQSQDEFREERLCEVRFVPLIGADGWHNGTVDDQPDPDPATQPSSGRDPAGQ